MDTYKTWKDNQWRRVTRYCMIVDEIPIFNPYATGNTPFLTYRSGDLGFGDIALKLTKSYLSDRI